MRRLVGPGLLGLAAVVAGVLVLQTPGATDVGVDPYGPAPSSSGWLDGLVGWNGIKLVGAGLTLTGAAVLVTVLAVIVGRTRGHGVGPTRLLVTGAFGAALMLGGALAFSRPGSTEVSYEGTYLVETVTIFRGEEPPPVVLATMVWTEGQVVAILVAVTGLLLACLVGGMAVGRLRRIRP